MYTVLFYYTLIILLICILAAATSLSAYFVSRRRTFLFALSGFLFYFFDVALVFQDDFISQNLIYQASSFWVIGNPFISILTGAGVLFSFWMLVCDYLGEKRRLIWFAPLAVYVVASLAVLWGIEDIRWREFSFYSMREVLLFWIYGFIAIRYISAHDDVERIRMRSHRIAYFAAIAITIAIVLENVYFQLVFDPSYLETGVNWFFAERSIAENMLLVCFAAIAFCSSARTLSLRFDKPPAGRNGTMQDSIDRIMPLYCKRHGLSERESEVLILIVLGKDNQNIASTMNLALSTVKVHVHNILHKTAQSNRQELIRDFWKG
jgi:DNA-binding CsgD family transcriptional regulator